MYRDPRIRRAQALAVTNGAGIAIARDLLDQKLRGQVDVLRQIPESQDARASVEHTRVDLARAQTAEQLRSLEAQAAAVYWQAWSPLEVPWARKDVDRVPEHWRMFGARTSPLTGSPRSAANPANALLNYLYAILKAEAPIALLSIGLDPGLGVLHADLRARDSLTLDLMEAVRPAVDGWLLDALSARTFRKGNFFETREGNCRLMPPLAKAIAETTPHWSAALAPVAEQAARILAQPVDPVITVPTPLTQANRRAGRVGQRQKSPRSLTPAPALPAACRQCGVLLNDADRVYCDECEPERRMEQVVSWASAGREILTQLREAGIDPAHSLDSGKKRGRRNAAHNIAAAAWEHEHEDGADLVDFAQDVLPKLESVPLRLMAEATGLSQAHCSFVRRGLRVPHHRHWEALTKLVQATLDKPQV